MNYFTLTLSNLYLLQFLCFHYFITTIIIFIKFTIFFHLFTINKLSALFEVVEV